MPKPVKTKPKPPAPSKEAVQAVCDDAAMRAKQAILARLEQYRADRHLSYTAAVQAFVEAVKAASQSTLAKSHPQHVEITDFELPYSIIRDAKGRNNKDGLWQIGRSTVYDWKSRFNTVDATSPRPRVKAPKGQLTEFNATCRFMASAPEHLLDMFAELYGPQLASALRRAGWSVQIEPVQRQS